MRAILIDAQNREIKEVEHSGELEDFYKLMNVRLIERVQCSVFGDDLYVDEEGLFHAEDRLTGGQTAPGFVIQGQPLYGNGLIIGRDDDGDTRATGVELERVKKMVMFFEDEPARSVPLL